MPEPILLSWSGGKDSALALSALRDSDQFEVAALVTTVTDAYDRISMHGVRRELLRMQAESLGLSLEEVRIPPDASNEVYEAAMSEAFGRHRERGVRHVAFGDLFLADIRAYRERLVERVGLQGVFPVWGRDTGELLHDFVAAGFKAVLCCIDTEVLDASFAGREIDESFATVLPEGVDPCGENGEFHTFVYDGPPFAPPIAVRRGRCEQRGRFRFIDLLPAGGESVPAARD